METTPRKEEQWEGKVTAKLPETKPHQAWQLLSDYCSLQKLLPSLDCHRVSGEEGRPGCIRRCAITFERKPGSAISSWADEELLSVDHRSLRLTYRILDNNMGFRRFLAEMKVFPEISGGAADGCRIEWSFVADPLEGRRLPRLIGFLDATLNTIARSIESKKAQGNL